MRVESNERGFAAPAYMRMLLWGGQTDSHQQ